MLSVKLNDSFDELLWAMYFHAKTLRNQAIYHIERVYQKVLTIKCMIKKFDVKLKLTKK